MIDWMRLWACVRVHAYKKKKKNMEGARAQGRATVCGELVKAGNASRRCIEPLDWPIIILGTHLCLFSPSVALSCVSPAHPRLLAPWFSKSLGYCSPNDLPCSELGA